MNLERSFSNYPNPFNPTIGEATTIAYVLDQDADVDIRVYALTGDVHNHRYPPPRPDRRFLPD